MLRNALIILALVVTVALPFALRPKNSLLGPADETLVIVTPHNEAIRAEFARGFRDWYHARTGKTVRIDWRTPGGTSEIARYLASEFEAPFENYWKNTLHRPWSDAVAKAFDDPKINPQRALEAQPSPKPAAAPPPPAKLSESENARWAFLNSNVGIGIDLFFGGGSFDFIQQANAGRLVDSGFIAAHPEIFNETETGIPQTLGGEPFYDKNGRWLGTVLSAFGICYNVDLERHIARSIYSSWQLEPEGSESSVNESKPNEWDSLTHPRYNGQVALADPNKSGSVAKAFEMIIQQQIQREFGDTESAQNGKPIIGAYTGNRPSTEEEIARLNEWRRNRTAQENLNRGWTQALSDIQKMGANARYFTDSATKIPIDVAQGDAAVGMCIDFYGRFESENARNISGGQERLKFFTPRGGTSIGVDPVGLLRGAPHRELALAFIEYVLSLDGQKLWNWQVGAPGGPQRYALRRLSIRRELYADQFKTFRSDPEVYPYEEAKNFTYHPEWTAALFNPIRFIVRVMCVDSHDEARDAWAALIAANFPPEATHVFEDVSAVNYAEAKGRIATVLRDPDKLVEARLATELSEHFRAQYRHAAELARAGK